MHSVNDVVKYEIVAVINISGNKNLLFGKFVELSDP